MSNSFYLCLWMIIFENNRIVMSIREKMGTTSPSIWYTVCMGATDILFQIMSSLKSSVSFNILPYLSTIIEIPVLALRARGTPFSTVRKIAMSLCC